MLIGYARCFTDTEDMKHMAVAFLGADFKERFQLSINSGMAGERCS